MLDEVLPAKPVLDFPLEALLVVVGWPIGKPLVDNLGEQIWEVRSRLVNRIARTLFIGVNEEIGLLHGFIKKDRKTPVEDLRMAKIRKSTYMSGHE